MAAWEGGATERSTVASMVASALSPASSSRFRTRNTAPSPAGGRPGSTVRAAASCTGSQERSTAPTTAASSSPEATARAPNCKAITPDSSSAITAKLGPRKSNLLLIRLAVTLARRPSTPGAVNEGQTPSAAPAPRVRQRRP